MKYDFFIIFLSYVLAPLHLFNFGLDWVVRQARDIGIRNTIAWSMGSLHPATRFNIDNDYGCFTIYL